MHYGFELPSSDRSMFMFQALGKQERHHLCPTSFEKENLKKILNASHLLILHPNFILVSEGRGGR